jgi:hypothetical protein
MDVDRNRRLTGERNPTRHTEELAFILPFPSMLAGVARFCSRLQATFFKVLCAAGAVYRA